MKKLVITLLILGVLGTGGYFAWQRFRPPTAAADTQTAAAPAGPVKAGGQVTVEGRVLPTRHTTLSFAAAGLVTEVLVKEGDPVQAGQVLARLQAARQTAALAQAEAEIRRGEARLTELRAGPRRQDVEAARANLAAAQARLAKVKQNATAAEIATAESQVYQAQARLAAEQSRPNPTLPDLEAARSALVAARAQLTRLKQGAAAADIAADIAAAEAEVRRAQAQLDLTLAGTRPESIATAEADLAAGRPAVQQAQAALVEAELRAPYAGTLATLDLKPGQYTSPGVPVARLADLTAWQVETEDLTELAVGRVSVGSPATLTFDAIPGLQLPAKVLRIRPMGEKRQGDMTYVAVIAPGQHDPRLRWNLTATVTMGGTP